MRRNVARTIQEIIQDQADEANAAKQYRNDGNTSFSREALVDRGLCGPPVFDPDHTATTDNFCEGVFHFEQGRVYELHFSATMVPPGGAGLFWRYAFYSGETLIAGRANVTVATTYRSLHDVVLYLHQEADADLQIGMKADAGTSIGGDAQLWVKDVGPINR